MAILALSENPRTLSKKARRVQGFPEESLSGTQYSYAARDRRQPSLRPDPKTQAAAVFLMHLETRLEAGKMLGRGTETMPDILTIETTGRGLIDITDRLAAIDAIANCSAGVAHLFVQHTSASLVIQENADPDVVRDLDDFFSRLAPEDFPYRHSAEGPDDMPAHIRSALTATSLSIPVMDGALALGTWQGVYLFEHRRRPHRRRVIVSVTPEI